MSIVLHHHPFTRAANVVWMLEEVGVPYELRFVDVMKGEHKAKELLALNPMGKLPILVDDGVVVTESAAIALFLGDRYASGTLAPAPTDPARGTYLRWAFFAPSVIEPGTMARREQWKVKTTAAGWGDYDAMLAAMRSAIEGKQYLLGDRFSMADVVFGGTIDYMLRFGLIEPEEIFTTYAERLRAREASKRAEAKNAAVIEAHRLARG